MVVPIFFKNIIDIYDIVLYILYISDANFTERMCIMANKLMDAMSGAVSTGQYKHDLYQFGTKSKDKDKVKDPMSAENLVKYLARDDFGHLEYNNKLFFDGNFYGNWTGAKQHSKVHDVMEEDYFGDKLYTMEEFVKECSSDGKDANAIDVMKEAVEQHLVIAPDGNVYKPSEKLVSIVSASKDTVYNVPEDDRLARVYPEGVAEKECDKAIEKYEESVYKKMTFEQREEYRASNPDKKEQFDAYEADISREKNSISTDAPHKIQFTRKGTYDVNKYNPTSKTKMVDKEFGNLGRLGEQTEPSTQVGE